MADPFSIAVGCVSLIRLSTGVLGTTRRIWDRYRGAATEIQEIAEEIGLLKELLEILQHAVFRRQDDPTSKNLATQINREIGKCEAVVRDIELLVEENDGRGRWDAAKWAATGHGKAEQLLKALKDGRERLEFVRETLTV